MTDQVAVALPRRALLGSAAGTGIEALFARVLAPLDGARRRDVARALVLRIGRTRAVLLAALAAGALALYPSAGLEGALAAIALGAGAALALGVATAATFAALRRRP